MEDDNPESLAHEMLTQSFWRGHPLGAPILGTRGTVRGFTRNSVVNCFERWYTPAQYGDHRRRQYSRRRSAEARG